MPGPSPQHVHHPSCPQPPFLSSVKQEAPPCAHALACAYLVSFRTCGASWVPLRAETVPKASHYSPYPSRTLGLAPHHWPGRRGPLKKGGGRSTHRDPGKSYTRGARSTRWPGLSCQPLRPNKARVSLVRGYVGVRERLPQLSTHSPPHRHPQLTFCPLGPMTQISPGRPCGWE